MLFSTLTTAVANITSDVVQDIEKGKLSASERRSLRDEGFLVRNDDVETKKALRYIEDVNAENTTFSSLVVLNLDCNLACKYCFEGTRKGKLYMSADTADMFVDYVRSRDLEGKDTINIMFYGGEPLLSMDTIARISEKLLTIAEAREMEYEFCLTSNGTLLTPRNVEKLKSLGLIGASITLDGPKHVHDAYRPFKTGKGSFDVIVDNIENACSLIDVQIGGNFTQGNYRAFPELLDCFLDRGLTPDKIAQVRFDPVVNEKSEFAFPDFHEGFLSVNEPWLDEAIVFLREEILKRGFRTLAVGPAVCMMEIRDNVAVNYDGTLYKCPGLIGRKEFCVGDLASVITDFRASHGIDSWKKNEECLACSYLPLCFGGCKYLKLQEDGTMDGVICRKDFFDKTLARLVFQDVKYEL